MKQPAEHFARAYPTLSALIASGVVRFEDSNYIGVASDNVEVILGHAPEIAESYLKDFPTPDKW